MTSRRLLAAVAILAVVGGVATMRVVDAPSTPTILNARSLPACPLGATFGRDVLCYPVNP